MTTQSHTEAPAEVLTQASEVGARPVYEIGFHVVPTLTQDGVNTVVDSIKTELQKHDAEIISEFAPERMKLAYTIVVSHSGKHQKSDEAYFGFIKFAVDRSAVPVLETTFRSNIDILRFLIVETTREDVGTPRRAAVAVERIEEVAATSP